MDINLKIQISKDKKITLTEEEARELYSKLDEMFGEKNYTFDWWSNPQTFSIPCQPSISWGRNLTTFTGTLATNNTL